MKIFQLDNAQFQKAYGIFCSTAQRGNDREGLYTTVCRIPAKEKTVKHSHFEAEIFVILRGKGLIEIDSEMQEVEAYDIIRLPPYSNHQLTNSGSEDLLFISSYSEDFEIPYLPKNCVVTAAPPTPNGPLHLGHISGPYLASDVMSRYLRMRSVEVINHSGTDDHQNYVYEKAKSLNETADSFRKKMRSRIQKGLEKLHIEFDEFIEPKIDSDYRNKIINFVKRAIDSQVIQRERLSFPYCSNCDQSLVDSLIEGICPVCNESSRGSCENCGIVVLPSDLLKKNCSQCKTQASSKEIAVYTFNLSRYLPLIRKDLEKLSLSSKQRSLIEKVEELNELKVLVSHPDKSEYGIPFPNTDQGLHVWFEMAAHYEKFSKGIQSWVHCFGFDNSFYYLLFIPALLKALDEKARFPMAIISNEFLLLEGLKFSTSRNHAIWADEFEGNSDHLRLYLSLQRPSHSTSNFSMGDFQKFSKELNIQLKSLYEKVSGLKISNGKVNQNCLIQCNRFTREMELYFSPQTFDLRQASRKLLNFLDCTLQLKDGGPSERLRVDTLATIMAPLMPTESETLKKALGSQRNAWVLDWSSTL